MTITKRLVKGSKLTHVELDGNFTDLESRPGHLTYEDITTTGTPISVTGGGGAVVLTNDAAGTDTDATYAPGGVTDVWNESTNVCDWSELSLGDIVEIGFHAEVVVATTNTEVFVDLHLGTGGGSYQRHIITPQNFKNTGTHHLENYSVIVMKDTNTLNNGGQFKITADKTCTVIVEKFFFNITKMT